MKHGSLFSGYGGLDRAIAEVFGAITAWVSDVDPGANAILAHRYPDAPNLGDITRVDWATVEPVDIISGGSPCQDLSMAGRRAGMTDGTRSNLWVSMREAIATIRPTFVIWENVYGALSANASSALEHCPGCMGDPRHGGPVLRALGRVLGDLADLGFDAEVVGLRAADVGACHGRFRVFVLAYARGIGGHQAIEHDGRGAQVADGSGVPHERDRHALRAGPDRALTLLPTPAAMNPNDGESVETWEARRQRTKERVGNGNGFGTPLSIAVQLLPTPAANLGSNGGPQHPDKRRAGGHSVSIEDAVHGLALLPLDRSDECTDGFAVGSVADSSERTPGQSDAPGAATASGGSTRSRWGDYAAAIASHERLTGRPAPNPTEPGANGKPRLSARFVEWMMCLPDGWVTDVPGITRNEALKALGNGVVTPQAVHALRVMLDRIGAA